MGLFGYDQKTFKKNTEKFKGRLEALIEKDEKSADLIRRIIGLLDSGSYPSDADGERMQEIDNRIEELIDKIVENFDSESMILADEHLKMLLNEVRDSRAAGKELYSQEKLERWEVKATLLNTIYQLEREVERLRNRLEAICRRAEEISEDSVEFQRLSDLNDDIESREMRIQKELAQSRKQYELFEKTDPDTP